MLTISACCHTFSVAARQVNICIPFAEIDCGPVPTISGLDRTSIDPERTFYGDSFMFTCKTVFDRLGNSTDPSDPYNVTCMADGHWNLGDLTCRGAYIFTLNILPIIIITGQIIIVHCMYCWFRIGLK